MAKQVAVLAVNPVNGLGLFQYLETFFEKGISYRVFAVSDSKTISTNSGIVLQADDVIASLKGQSDHYDALVFSCGDAVPVFQNNATKSFNLDLLTVIQEFAGKHKIMAGCRRFDIRDGRDYRREKISRSSFSETGYSKRYSYR